jgi:7,8-dihydropterin-6-yl-methyl-4-(beta-D-ribofuranosyl)aminobenzene 5'-phosphate synthase
VKIVCVVENNVIANSDLQSEHGLSFWIETPDGAVLLDTGQTASVFSHNLEKLGLLPQTVSALALSHSHYDHTGGLEIVLAAKNSLPIYANPDLFRPRYALRNGEYHSIGMKISQSTLSSQANIKLSDTPIELIPGLWTTGEIVERPEPQGSSPHLFIQTVKGWEPDPYLDDMSLVYKTSNGLVLICGCCHAGILNTLFHVKRIFSEPIIAIIGGIHLNHADNQYLDHVVEVIAENFPSLDLYLNHCTGETAFAKLSKAFGQRVKKYPAGSILKFE